MSAPTPPSRPLHLPAPAGQPDSGRRMVLPARTTAGTVFDVVARVGTAVTLAALLVLTGTVLGVVDAVPTPVGAATGGR